MSTSPNSTRSIGPSSLQASPSPSVSHNSLGCQFLTFVPFKGTLDTQLNQNFGGGAVSCLRPLGTELV